MDKLLTVKHTLCCLIGALGSVLCGLLGGWDSGLKTLIIFMSADYVTGIIVAGVFKKSAKSKNGALESRAGFKGLCRKGVMLILVMVAYGLDVVTGNSYIRDMVIIALCANEAISIVENAGLMGIKVPRAITNAIDILNKKSERGGEK